MENQKSMILMEYEAFVQILKKRNFQTSIDFPAFHFGAYEQWN